MRFSRFGIVLLAATAASPALAGHGKVGLWEVTTTTSGQAMTAQLPPAVLARMRAHGMNMQGNSFTAQHCMTEDEVKMDKPPPMPKHHGQECKVQNLRTAGKTISADMVCSGNANGTGHFSSTYDSPERYSGRMSFNMTVNGHTMAVNNSFEGRWISASCGAVKH